MFNKFSFISSLSIGMSSHLIPQGTKQQKTNNESCSVVTKTYRSIDDGGGVRVK